MQPTPGTSCASFHELFGTFATALDAGTSTFHRYITAPDFDVDKALGELPKLQEKLRGAYKEKARDMVSGWVRDNAKEKDYDWAADAVRVLDNGRVVLGDREKFSIMAYYISDATRYFPSLIQKIDIAICGLNSPHITSIDHLEEVTGIFQLLNTHNLTSMERLRTVGKGLYVNGKTQLSSFPSLEMVGTDVSINNPHAKIDFPKLRKTDSFTIINAPMGAYPFLEEVGEVTVKNPKGEPTPCKRLEKISKAYVSLPKLPLELQGLPPGTKFRDIFPNLRVIEGEDSRGHSIDVDTPELQQEITALQQAGELSFPGSLFLLPS